MTLAVTYTRAQAGIHAPLITVEVHIANGLPSFSIVGLPETAVKESKDRVRAALLNSRFDFPARRITVNLAPADLPKEGCRFDLAIAIGLLAATQQLSSDALAEYEFLGELALSGELRPVKGVLPTVIQTRAHARTLVLPTQNLSEACLVNDAQLIGVQHLLEISAHLNGQTPLQRVTCAPITLPTPLQPLDMADAGDVLEENNFHESRKKPR